MLSKFGLVFFEKLDFLKKTFSFFFKNGKGCKFAVECESNDIISQKCLFHLNGKVFLQKKYREIFNFGKIRKFDEASIFFAKSVFILLNILNKIGGRKIYRL